MAPCEAGVLEVPCAVVVVVAPCVAVDPEGGCGVVVPAVPGVALAVSVVLGVGLVVAVVPGEVVPPVVLGGFVVAAWVWLELFPCGAGVPGLVCAGRGGRGAGRGGLIRCEAPDGRTAWGRARRSLREIDLRRGTRSAGSSAPNDGGAEGSDHHPPREVLQIDHGDPWAVGGERARRGIWWGC